MTSQSGAVTIFFRLFIYKIEKTIIVYFYLWLQEIREMLLSRGVQTGSITLSSGSGAGPNWARAGLVMMTGSVTTAASAGSQLQDHQLDGFGSTVETIDNIWEDWKQTARDRLDGCTIRGHKVSLCPSPTENLLCVARLPRDLHDEEFRDLVAAYGEIRRSFLLYSDKTGQLGSL